MFYGTVLKILFSRRFS